MDRNETQSPRGPAAADRSDGGSAVTSARAQFEAAAGSRRPARTVPAATEPVFDRFDWSAAVGATVQAATVHMAGRRDGVREVLMYDLDGTGLLACRDEDADGHAVALHFVSASSRDAYERVLRSVGYLNRAAHPRSGARRFDVEVVDATGFPVRIGERTVWVEAAAAAATADTFDTLAPEVIRLDVDDHVMDTAAGFDGAFAAWSEAPAAPRPAAQTPAATGTATLDGDRFAAHYGERGYWVHRQSEARAAAVRAAEPVPAPSVFRDGAEIYHIYRPAGAIAAPGEAAATLTPEPPVAFAPEERPFRVFRRRAPAPGVAAAATTASVTPRHPPAEADREALHFADLFEVDADGNGLEPELTGREARDFLFGLGKDRAAA